MKITDKTTPMKVLTPQQALLAAHLAQHAINAKWGCQQEPKTRNHKDALRLIKLLREIGNPEEDA